MLALAAGPKFMRNRPEHAPEHGPEHAEPTMVLPPGSSGSSGNSGNSGSSGSSGSSGNPHVTIVQPSIHQVGWLLTPITLKTQIHKIKKKKISTGGAR